MTNRHKTSVTIIAVVALAAVLVVAGAAASVGSDHMAFARTKSSTTSARSLATTPHPSNSGIKVVNVNDQRNLKCSTAGEGSAITGGSCTNAAASATDVSGGVTGSSSSGGNSGIAVINRNLQSGMTCSTAGGTSPIDSSSCANSASSSTTVSGGVTR